tara:strand:+ start:462 stop:1427 length:966 start_codon:yes stop_codon:yes gene_type:complete
MGYRLRQAIVAAVSGGGINIADVFKATAYTGTGSTVSLVTGLDFIANDGLVWTKRRNGTADHHLVDTVRGATNYVETNTANAEAILGSGLQVFNNDGYQLGGSGVYNASGSPYIGWQFIKSPKFFDVMTYSGDGVAGRQIPHGLGVQAGLVIVKCTTNSTQWFVQHVSRGGTSALQLNSNAGETVSNVFWDDTTADDTAVTLGDDTQVNGVGRDYVMYVFAHDPSAGGVVQCGQYTVTGGVNPVVDLGWQPQYLLFKSIDSATGWFIFDTARGIVVGSGDLRLTANANSAEVSTNSVDLTATGFQTNFANNTYVYMAIKGE